VAASADAVQRWAASVLGPVEAHPAPGQHDRVHTWRLCRGDAEWFARVGLPARKRRQERRVAEELWPLLGRRSPQLVHEDAVGLIMTALPGRHDTGPAAARSAGQLLAAVHALPVDDRDPLPLDAAVAQRAAAQVRRLERRGLTVPAALHRPPVGLGPRRWCHRDLQPANWLWDGHETRLVDWEHARPDAAVLGLGKISTMACWRVFSEGYTAAAGPVDPALLHFARALHGAATLTWGHEHDDDAFIAEGERVLGRLG
jgi:hypothetical protein